MRVRQVGKGAGVVAVLAFTLLPVWMMVSTAVNGRANSGSRAVWPEQFTFSNFVGLFRDGEFGGYLVNSVIVAAGTVFVSGLLALLAAVAVARFRFRFRTSVLMMVLIVQMVPLEALVIPLFVQIANGRENAR